MTRRINLIDKLSKKPNNGALIEHLIKFHWSFNNRRKLTGELDRIPEGLRVINGKRHVCITSKVRFGADSTEDFEDYDGDENLQVWSLTTTKDKKTQEIKHMFKKLVNNGKKVPAKHQKRDGFDRYDMYEDYHNELEEPWDDEDNNLNDYD